MTEPGGDITELLWSARAGDPEAMNELVPRVYSELKKLAVHFMRRERADHTLEPTALVNEAYLKLVDLDRVDWQDRSHFFVVAATAMRRILVDHAKSRRRKKRGGDWVRSPLDPELAVRPGEPSVAFDLVDLDQALQKLAASSERRARVVELRYFMGLGVDETAQLLDVSPGSVKNDWQLAKAWLLRELSRG